MRRVAWFLFTCLNIAAIYGVEERALVMELVEGESPNGPMPFDDAWKIAMQITKLWLIASLVRSPMSWCSACSCRRKHSSLPLAITLSRIVCGAQSFSSSRVYQV
jgi:hypothetical protein